MAHNEKEGQEAATPAELCHADADDVTRHSFRTPVGEADHLTVAIAGQRHPVADIGSHGIGILLSQGAALVPGQTHDLLLATGRETLALKGLVRHVTMDDESGAFHCGIQLLALDPATEEKLLEFVLRQRHHLFAAPPA